MFGTVWKTNMKNSFQINQENEPVKNPFEDQKKFMSACDQTVESFNLKQYDMYTSLVTEEYQELMKAISDRNLVEQVDALVDILVVSMGSLISLGINPQEVWDEVMSTNFAKIDDETGKVRKREDGKVLKPQGWTPPEITRFITMNMVKEVITQAQDNTDHDKKDEQEPFTARLVSYSNPVSDLAEQGIDDLQELVAFCARVSNPSNQMNTETSERLINYLIKHAHWSPLEMVNVCLEIETTRDIAHQIVRHWSFRFQEFSQRYANPAELGNQFVLCETRLQDTKNRQNSIEINSDSMSHLAIHNRWLEEQQDVIYRSKKAYEWAINAGIAKELARKVLPEGLTKTRLYMNGSLRGWIHYVELRSANGTQKEHMEIARCCAQAISEVFPMIDNYAHKDEHSAS